MPSKAKPIQKAQPSNGGMTPGDTGGQTRRKRKIGNEKSINARNKLSARKRMELATGTTSAPKGVENIGLKRAIGRPKPPKAPIRKMPITSAPKGVKNIGLKKAIGRPKPPKAPIRNMAVTGPKRRTGWGGRSTPRNLRRFR